MQSWCRRMTNRRWGLRPCGFDGHPFPKTMGSEGVPETTTICARCVSRSRPAPSQQCLAKRFRPLLQGRVWLHHRSVQHVELPQRAHRPLEQLLLERPRTVSVKCLPVHPYIVINMAIALSLPKPPQHLSDSLSERVHSCSLGSENPRHACDRGVPPASTWRTRSPSEWVSLGKDVRPSLDENISHIVARKMTRPLHKTQGSTTTASRS